MPANCSTPIYFFSSASIRFSSSGNRSNRTDAPEPGLVIERG